MVKILFVVLASVLLLSALPSQSQAHSLEWVENNIGKKGKFFKPIHKKAPFFELLDHTGNKVSANSYPGKIIILFFADGSCAGTCLKQIERMAQFQSMLNITPMRDEVQFVVVADEKQSIVETKIDPANWVFVAGDKNVVVQLKKDFGHSDAMAFGTITHVIDSKGQWWANFRGVKFKLVNFVVYINALLNSIKGVKDGHGL